MLTARRASETPSTQPTERRPTGASPEARAAKNHEAKTSEQPSGKEPTETGPAPEDADSAPPMADAAQRSKQPAAADDDLEAQPVWLPWADPRMTAPQAAVTAATAAEELAGEDASMVGRNARADLRSTGLDSDLSTEAKLADGSETATDGWLSGGREAPGDGAMGTGDDGGRSQGGRGASGQAAPGFGGQLTAAVDAAGPLPATGAAASAAGAAGTAALPTPGVDSPARQIAPPLHSAGFAPALGAQLNLMVRDGVTEARLHLNPAEMGPISVQIRIMGQQARVEMVAEQAITRQVLEQAMPTLAGALRENGLTLTGGGVFDQARDPRQSGQAGAGGQSSGDRRGSAASRTLGLDMGPAEGARQVALPRGVVDVYA
jgi:flagellar hook-length control protein FliK